MQSAGVTPATGTAYEPLPTDHAFGNPKSGVTVIEYASPTCPVCANFMMTLYPRLKSGYIDKGRIFYVYRTFLQESRRRFGGEAGALPAEEQIHGLHRPVVPQPAEMGL